MQIKLSIFIYCFILTLFPKKISYDIPCESSANMKFQALLSKKNEINIIVSSATILMAFKDLKHSICKIFICTIYVSLEQVDISYIRLVDIMSYSFVIC